MNTPINFNEIEEFSKHHVTIVMTGLLVNDYDETIEAMNETFTDIGFITNGRVTELKHIEGNVLGDKGRSDFLIICSEGTKFNPIKRLQMSDIKWTDDFIDNYRRDYK